MTAARPVTAEEERLIRARIFSASRKMIGHYPEETLQQLLDDARSLAGLLNWERSFGALDAYDMLSVPEQREIVLKIADMLTSNPNFRWWVEDEVLRAEDSDANSRIRQLRSMFEIGQDGDHIWVWIYGLKTFGEGETWGEARNDTLDEIGYALQELWEAQETGRVEEDDE